MPSSSSNVEVVYRASNLSMVARQALERIPIDSSVILPTLDKCVELDRIGQSPPDHWWIVVYSGSNRVALVISCTGGYMGAYPILIVNPNAIDYDDFVSCIHLSAVTLQRHVPIERVYSVFAPIEIAQLFSRMWTQLTGIQPESQPYYDAKISLLRWHEGLHQSLTASETSMYEVGLAGPADILPIAKLCHGFASDSVSHHSLPFPSKPSANICSQPPFTLTEESALIEAKKLVSSRQVWTHKFNGRVVSIAAFTRNTRKIATITKVITFNTSKATKYWQPIFLSFL